VDTDLSNRVGEADERFVPSTNRGSLVEAEHLLRYWWAAQLASGRRVLDAGCGVGYGTAMLAAAGAQETVGVDLSSDAVNAAAAGAQAATFMEGDVHALPFEDDRFDVVVCFEVIEHVDRQDEVIAELDRVLAPSGVLLISSPNRGVYPPGNPHHVHEYVPEELLAALHRRFPQVELRRQHQWMASAVLDDEQAADDTLAERRDVRIAKVFGGEPASESYTLGLASHDPLPPVSSRVVLGAPAEVRTWLDELRTLREATDWSEKVIEARTLERDRARENIAGLQGVEAQLRSDNATLLADLERLRNTLRDIHGSLSWRATRPLRAVQRLRR
jgi:SAM-dependent methyltransferase